jgi:hypothetical protein
MAVDGHGWVWMGMDGYDGYKEEWVSVEQCIGLKMAEVAGKFQADFLIRFLMLPRPGLPRTSNEGLSRYVPR